MTMKIASTADQKLKATGKRVFEDKIDTGGMFPDERLIIFDETPDVALPYLGFVGSGWGGGRGCRHATYEAAYAYIMKISEEMYG